MADSIIPVVKVVRTTIELGGISLEVFQLPDSTYELSQTQVAEAIEKTEINVRRFLKAESLQALPGKEFTPVKMAVEGTKTKINAIPVPVAIAYWVNEVRQGNKKAIDLITACAIEAIERRRTVATLMLLKKTFPIIVRYPIRILTGC
jgi:hypothetical protein